MRLKILRKCTHPCTITCENIKITVWLDKTFPGFTKLNPISNYRKLSSEALANYRTFPFRLSQKPLQLSVNFFYVFTDLDGLNTDFL